MFIPAEVIAEVSNLHSDASDRLEAVKEQLAAKSDVVSDTGPLQLIRKEDTRGFCESLHTVTGVVYVVSPRCGDCSS